MLLALHPEITIQKLRIGNEESPLLVIDNFLANPEELVKAAAGKKFYKTTQYFPGIRAKGPLQYQMLISEKLQTVFSDFFEIKGSKLSFSMCHYSIVTTPPSQLAALQRIPHIDSTDSNGLASVHYLFRGSLGGTAFYRHRKTGFEYIDQSRAQEYFASLEGENDGPDMPAAEYINGDTALFEQIGKQEGVFNRMLVYRRNMLHSGSISRDFVPDEDPRTGRLSINCFMDFR